MRTVYAIPPFISCMVLIRCHLIEILYIEHGRQPRMLENRDKTLSSNTSYKRKRSTSPFGKCVRRRWTEEEKTVAYGIFNHNITNKIQPSFKEIQKMKDENPTIFAERSCATIKTWINNQMKKNI
ncbi:hypothetical protein PUN28_019760 [Cardiocondyla obscurior]|uniref:Uncharacterized protein n=1 Tax=Cardiocondyla obscurior TaxID=286306 RepID=A0AAW2ED37_9HYME